MPLSVCITCGTQFPPLPEPPESCPICTDERQYVGLDGQQWTTLEQLRSKHKNEFHACEDSLTAILTKPAFGIGQRAFMLESPGGNILWDCLALIDDDTIRKITERGGLAAIAISHPHYYTSMVEWSRAFGGIPIYLHVDDREWVMRPDAVLHFWDRETLRLHDGISLIRCGGHFKGGAVLHWPTGANGRGVMLSGDVIQVVPDRRWVSFMYSYPNLIPLGPEAIKRIVAAVEPFEFERVYGAFHRMEVIADAKCAVRRSAERYLKSIGS